MEDDAYAKLLKEKVAAMEREAETLKLRIDTLRGALWDYQDFVSKRD